MRTDKTILNLLLFFSAFLLLNCAEDNPLVDRDGILAIDSISPSIGQVGTEVRIYGKGFSGTADVNIVDINGKLATVKSPAAMNTLIIIIPDDATSGPIAVKNGSQRVGGPIFTVVDPPILTLLSPSSGYANDRIAISGSKLQQVTGVLFNGAPATITSKSDNEIIVTAPTSSTGSVSVLYEHGTVTGPIFTYLPLPRIDTAAIVRLSRVEEGLLLICEHFDPGTDDVRVLIDGDERAVLQSGVVDGRPYVVVDVPPRNSANPLTLEVVSNGRKSEPYEYVIKPDLSDISVQNDGYPVAVTLYGRFFGNADDQRFIVVSVNGRQIDVQVTRWDPTEIDFTVPGFGTPDFQLTYSVKVVVMTQESETLQFYH